MGASRKKTTTCFGSARLPPPCAKPCSAATSQPPPPHNAEAKSPSTHGETRPFTLYASHTIKTLGDKRHAVPPPMGKLLLGT